MIPFELNVASLFLYVLKMAFNFRMAYYTLREFPVSRGITAYSGSVAASEERREPQLQPCSARLTTARTNKSHAVLKCKMLPEISCALLLSSGILLRILLELFFTAFTAKVIGLTLMFRRCGCILSVDLHATHGISFSVSHNAPR